eukprot:TRINITY_DN14329_c0_g1_i1.p1 TRINITY_DN14329_c0_g1~~TRINITY_DN14329_c0_g1_i1.p1  ORF type:complete len:126 (+),score=18.13 TRINITY_DN14329_c0_g1_i1:41-379(+)
MTKVEDTFLVYEQLGGGKALKLAVEASSKGHMKLLPWGGVAAHLWRDGKPLPRQSRFGGSAFCFLPLPILTGLPIHVNGYFELSSNRRDLWWEIGRAVQQECRDRSRMPSSA